MTPVFYAVNQGKENTDEFEWLTFRLVSELDYGVYLVLGICGFCICLGIDY